MSWEMANVWVLPANRGGEEIQWHLPQDDETIKWKSWFPGELWEIRASSFHVRILSFFGLFSTVEDQCRIPAKLLWHKSRYIINYKDIVCVYVTYRNIPPPVAQDHDSFDFLTFHKLIPEDQHDHHQLHWVQISTPEWLWGCSLRFAGTISQFRVPNQQAAYAKNIAST